MVFRVSLRFHSGFHIGLTFRCQSFIEVFLQGFFRVAFMGFSRVSYMVSLAFFRVSFRVSLRFDKGFHWFHVGFR